MAIHSSIAKLTECKHITNVNQWYKFIFINVHELCRDPSLGLTTKANGFQGCGSRLSLGVPFICLGVQKSVRERTLTLPSEFPCWKLESRWTLECSESDCEGQNPMVQRVFYIIEFFLKHIYLKWACITHFDI